MKPQSTGTTSRRLQKRAPSNASLTQVIGRLNEKERKTRFGAEEIVRRMAES